MADPIAPVLAGPILRRAETGRLTFWLATSDRADVQVALFISDEPLVLTPRLDDELYILSAGDRLHYLLIDCQLPQELPKDQWIGYRLSLRFSNGGEWQDHTHWAPDLCFPGAETPGFVIPARVRSLLHGSCRKPHHPSGDGLIASERHLAALHEAQDWSRWPSLLLMSGDQVYTDDVAGPMLSACHQLADRLRLPAERLDVLENADIDTSAELERHPDTFYRRDALLPKTEGGRALTEVLFHGIQKPIFTSDHALNHLMTMREMLAMYLLVWSPAAWQGITPMEPAGLTEEESAKFAEEAPIIARFAATLPQIRRSMAHMPVAMIFDDHDVTDDWNLTRDWEERAYDHPFSRRIIGNALVAYLINQGWGNKPEAFSTELLDRTAALLRDPGGPGHDPLIDTLLEFEAWDYIWETKPALVVLDTRTRRWRSEGSGNKPSGLLDWEAVTDLQRSVRNRQAVLLVSAAPIFGVKLIETVQQIVSFFGKPLMVDAEYWMGHTGTADAVMNVFRHRKTPDRFIILSGDVHYSFVYDVELRGRRGGPQIWQVCSSGFKNGFPAKLLNFFDHGNRWLFAANSPLNWFTKRRGMKIVPRKPEGTPHGRRLLLGEGTGLVELNDEGAPMKIAQLLTDGGEVVFSRRDGEARWE